MGYTQQKYSGVKRVYHNISTGLTTYERIDRHQTKFDSTSEFKTFILLEECLCGDDFEIEVHPVLSVDGTEWEIDFGISANKDSPIASRQLAAIVNSVNGTEYLELSRIFVEYKGFQDKNFITKMTNVVVNAPMFSRTIILVSEHVGAFGCYNSVRERFHCHPVTSIGILERILRTNTSKTRGVTL
ncbi:MAG: hypothetical protein V7L31_23085 [Nostoc sp.]|uniref:hypothetical protein n=1 Tax=Nostoc sp. TaxID=1180 RepID=UPI002FF1CABF